MWAAFLLYHAKGGSGNCRNQMGRKPVSDGVRYDPKLSTRFAAQEIKETGNEED